MVLVEFVSLVFISITVGTFMFCLQIAIIHSSSNETMSLHTQPVVSKYCLKIWTSTRPLDSLVTHLVDSLVTHPVDSLVTHLVDSLVTHPVGSLVTHPVGSLVRVPTASNIFSRTFPGQNLNFPGHNLSVCYA